MRHWDSYDQIEVHTPDGELGILHRHQCTPYEWSLLVREAQAHAWWDEFFYGRLGHEIAVLNLCDPCQTFSGVETEGTTEEIPKSRCLRCGAITTHDELG